MKYYSEGEYPIFYGSEGAAGLDLPFFDPDNKEIVLKPGESFNLKTGIHLEIPEGYVGILDSRSSTSKLKLDLLAHTIDCDYRGNIRIAVINNGTETVTVYRGDYLAQIVIIPYNKVSLQKVSTIEELSSTYRGENSFGSTGNATHNK